MLSEDKRRHKGLSDAFKLDEITRGRREDQRVSLGLNPAMVASRPETPPFRMVSVALMFSGLGSPAEWLPRWWCSRPYSLSVELDEYWLEDDC
jgi:hypothetical protein